MSRVLSKLEERYFSFSVTTFFPESQNVNFFITPHECHQVLLKNVKPPIFTCTIKAFVFHGKPPDS